MTTLVYLVAFFGGLALVWTTFGWKVALGLWAALIVVSGILRNAVRGTL